MENSQICEYSVKQRIEGKWILKRGLLIALYVLIGLLSSVIGLLMQNVVPFAAIGMILAFTTYTLTWRLTKVEYEYAMTGGLLIFSIIYGGSAKRTVFTKNLASIEAAFAYKSEKAVKMLEKYAPEVQYFALSTTETDETDEREVWCCLFENEDGKKSVFFFELCDKAYRCLKTYAPSATGKRN